MAIPGFIRCLRKKPGKVEISHECISVIIPFRNDIDSLYQCVASLSGKSPLIDEIIIVNDHCEEEDCNLFCDKMISAFNEVRLVCNPPGAEGKRAALKTGITAARNAKIMISDADCIWATEAVQEMVNSRKARLTTAMVVYQDGKDLFHPFMKAELFLLNSYGAAYAFLQKPFLASGAAMLFNQRDFAAYLSESETLNIRSGDDMFFMEYIRRRYGRKAICHLSGRNAVVETEIPGSWGSYLRQRSRWGRKTPKIRNPLTIALALATAAFPAGFTLLCIAGMTNSSAFCLAVIVILLKTLTENTIMLLSSRVYRRRKTIGATILVSLLSPFVFLIIAARMIFVRDRWQGRNYLDSTSGNTV